MKATLSVRMENDAMLTGSDLAWLLDQAAARLRREVSDDRVSIRDGFALRDINGEGVGRLNFEEEYVPEVETVYLTTEARDRAADQRAEDESMLRSEAGYERSLERPATYDDEYVGPTYREYED